MKPLIFLLLLLPFLSKAQHVFTLDPEKDPIARRAANETIQLVVPAQVLSASVQETFPQLVEVQTFGLEKIGKSHYLIASGRQRSRPEYSVSVAILLVETAAGEFQTDQLVISCSSAGDCRECSFPPVCTCNKGEGSCGQSSAMVPLKKVTVTLSN